MIRKQTARGFSLAALALFCLAVFFPVQPALATGNSGEDAEAGWVEMLSDVLDAILGADGEPLPATGSEDGENGSEPQDIGNQIDPNGG